MNKDTIPTHILLIPDGNRRWAKSRGLASIEGYKKVDYNHLERLFLDAMNYGVKYISLWIFSTENWRRPKSEIRFLFSHFLNNVDDLLEGAMRHKVRIQHIGRKDRLPKKIVEALYTLEEETKNNKKFNIQLCLDYGGRDEVIRAINKLLESGVKQIDEAGFFDYLDTKGIPDPDLIIRTSGEQRLSGFMPFQAAYAELYFSNVHFPDFDARELRKAVEEYGKRQRRFGGG